MSGSREREMDNNNPPIKCEFHCFVESKKKRGVKGKKKKKCEKKEFLLPINQKDSLTY